jgi:hypothetical protein
MSDSQQQVEKIQEQIVSSTHPELAPVHEFIAQNAGTMVKLATFSAALFAFPIVTFFVTLHSLFDGKFLDLLSIHQPNCMVFIIR